MEYWTWRGISFSRAVGSDTDSRWFLQETQRTVDVVAGGTTRIVDIGGVAIDPLTLTIGLDSEGTAATLASLRGQTGVLINVGGQSATALLVRADRLVSDGAVPRMICTWEAL